MSYILRLLGMDGAILIPHLLFILVALSKLVRASLPAACHLAAKRPPFKRKTHAAPIPPVVSWTALSSLQLALPTLNARTTAIWSVLQQVLLSGKIKKSYVFEEYHEK